jgi:hypothetical protein
MSHNVQFLYTAQLRRHYCLKVKSTVLDIGLPGVETQFCSASANCFELNPCENILLVLLLLPCPPLLLLPHGFSYARQVLYH